MKKNSFLFKNCIGVGSIKWFNPISVWSISVNCSPTCVRKIKQQESNYHAEIEQTNSENIRVSFFADSNHVRADTSAFQSQAPTPCNGNDSELELNCLPGRSVSILIGSKNDRPGHTSHAFLRVLPFDRATDAVPAVLSPLHFGLNIRFANSHVNFVLVTEMPPGENSAVDSIPAWSTMVRWGHRMTVPGQYCLFHTRVVLLCVTEYAGLHSFVLLVDNYCSGCRLVCCAGWRWDQQQLDSKRW